jgi:hypothetical protein
MEVGYSLSLTAGKTGGLQMAQVAALVIFTVPTVSIRLSLEKMPTIDQ